ncbi:NAD(P)H-binding protein [Alkalihalophilus pseudofirmus]|uniref:SDR family oxidoreductase n=1 Tax=Alkalihalophilus pseudofirmus TaxID=79885 RepID=UPI00259B8B38|nr:NAD(P)H-binding protein [Alkalihalophilus pseudofirmus]WEG18960.1 NAD(P)H-binding protein [Alkalihalophilus pseudofirmus]
MRVLVVGASGNVGTFVTKNLLKMGEQVVAAGTNVKRLQDMFVEKVDPVFFDLSKKETFNAALEEIDRVILMRPPHLG